MRQSRRFAGGAAGNQKINARFDLPANQVTEGRVIQAAILFKGGYKGGAATTQCHLKRIVLSSENLKSSRPQRHRGTEKENPFFTTEGTEITEFTEFVLFISAPCAPCSPW